MRRMLVAVCAIMTVSVASTAPAQTRAEMAEMEARILARLESRLAQESDALRTEQVALRTSVEEAVRSMARSESALDRTALSAIDVGRIDDGVGALEERARVRDASVRGAPVATPTQLAQRAEEWKRIGALAFLDSTPRAIQAYEQALTFAPNDPVALDQLASLYGRVGRGDDTRRLAQRLQSLPDAESQVRGLIQEASVTVTTHPRAEALWERAGNLAEANNLPLLLSQILSARSLIPAVRRDYDRATRMAQQALNIARVNGFRREEGDAYFKIGAVHFIRSRDAAFSETAREQDLDRAAEYYARALQIYRDLNQRQDLGSVLNEAARVERLRSRPEEAVGLVSEAVEIAEALNDRGSAGWAYKTLGVIYGNPSATWPGDAVRSDEYFGRAREMLRGIPNLEALTLWEWADAQNARGNRTRACELIREANTIWDRQVAGAPTEAQGIDTDMARYCGRRR